MKKLKFGLALALLLGGFAAVGAVVAPSASEVKRVEAATQQSIKLDRNNTFVAAGGSGSSYVTGTNKNIGGTNFTFNCAGANSSIQLRSKDNSGIVTVSALSGYLKKVVVVWNTNTASGRTLDIYGKTSAYTGTANLYNTSTAGTKLGSIKYGTSTELTVSGNYEYVGLRSNSSAMYLTSIELIYEIPESTVSYTTTFDGNGGTVDGSAVKTIETPVDNDVTMPTPYRAKHRFLGWYDAPEGGNKVETLVSSPETDGTTLYAHWEEIFEPAVKNATIAELVAKGAHNDQLYTVSGTFTEYYITTKDGAPTENHLTYGNFYLADGDASILVYGATKKASALAFDEDTGFYSFTNPKDFKTTVSLEAGDIVTMTVFVIEYKGTPQLNGVITNIEKPLPPEPTLEEKLAEFTTNASVGFSYTKSGEDYTFSNVRLSFRGTISAELYEEVVAAGVTAAGIECSIEGEEPYTIDCSANIGTDAEGNRYVFGSLLVPEGKENVVVTGKAFVTVDGARLYLASTAHSLVSAVSAYLGDNAPALTAEQLEAVTALAASLGIAA